MNTSSDRSPLHESDPWSQQEAAQIVTGMDEIVEQFGPALWRLAGSFEFDSALREDLVQDMLVAV